MAMGEGGVSVYRIVIYSDGEVIEDAEFSGFTLLTKRESDDDHNPRWHRTIRGLNDMETVGLLKWGYDIALEENSHDNHSYEGPP